VFAGGKLNRFPNVKSHFAPCHFNAEWRVLARAVQKETFVRAALAIGEPGAVMQLEDCHWNSIDNFLANSLPQIR
jgi:hypothetical protein